MLIITFDGNTSMFPTLRLEYTHLSYSYATMYCMSLMKIKLVYVCMYAHVHSNIIIDIAIDISGCVHVIVA